MLRYPEKHHFHDVCGTLIAKHPCLRDRFNTNGCCYVCILMSYLLCRDNVPCAILLNKNKKIAICFLGVGFFFLLTLINNNFFILQNFLLYLVWD